MKKVISLLLAVVMLCSTFSGLQITSHALSSSGSCGEDVTYTFYNGTLTISGNGAMTNYPSLNSPFYNQSSIKTVVIESGVTSIGYAAFFGCNGLTGITIPDSVTSIGEGAFQDCSGLTSITIPDSVTSIGSDVFRRCSGLISVIIGNSVTSIGEFAFSGCNGLTGITIPDSVTSIGTGAFSGCSSLTRVDINSIEAWCKISFVTNPSRPLCYPYNLYLNGELVTDLVIPNSVTSISSDAFYACSGLTSVTIPDSVISIGDEAFRGCSGLASVTIGDSVTSIGDEAFRDCSGLTSVVIGNSVKSIGNYAFQNCSGLTNITISESVSCIGNEVFEGCENLKVLTLPNIEEVIVISYNAYGRRRGSFNNLKLERINFLDTPDEWVKRYLFNSAKSISFNGIVYKDIELNSEEICPNTFKGNEDIENLLLTQNVERMGNSSFDLCSNLKQITIPYHLVSYSFDDLGKRTDEKFKGFYNSPIEKITFNDNPTEISDKFNNLFKLESLKEFEIPESVSYIGDAAFKDCKNLTKVTIPKSVTRIEYNAFSGCTNLTVRGYQDSYAETFCKLVGIPFEAIQEPHTHSFTATVTLPTCTEQGFTTHICSCGDVIVDTYIPATGHSWSGWQIVSTPTCEKTGLSMRMCNNCNQVDKLVIPALEHTFSAQTTPPTCAHTGFTTYTCADCGYSYIGDIVPMAEHSYQDFVTEPTTESQGYTVHMCTVCGYSYVDSITDILPSQMHYIIPSLADIQTTVTIKSDKNEYSVTAANGVFELNSIHGDVYRVYAKQKNSLTVCIGEYDTENGEIINDSDIVFPLGDVNSDDVIDIADISLLLAAGNYGQVNAALDLTGDGLITMDEISTALTATNFGKTSEAIV